MYWVVVEGEPTVGSFYTVDALPDSLMESQLAFIRKAAADFEGHSA